MAFIHLRTRSHHSLKEGLMDPDQVAEKASELGYSAVALTDLGTLSGLPSFFTEAKEKNINPIMGVDLRLETDVTNPDNTQETRLLLIAENNTGYKKLLELVTKTNVEGQVDKNNNKLCKQSWLEKMDLSGLIALTGDPVYGEIPRVAIQAEQKENLTYLKNTLNFYKKLFSQNLFLEISRYDHPQESLWVKRLIDLSQATKIPVVATHGVLFGDRADFFAHEVHSAITKKEKVTDPDYKPTATREQYMTSEEEMMSLFEDIPQALENAALIAKKCHIENPFGVNHLPRFPLPEGETDLDKYFVNLSREGLEKRLVERFPNQKEREQHRSEYAERLENEIKIILNMGFPGYFLVVSDFIRWSKDQKIPVGPGRGSGAGSLVAYALNITDIDPIKYSLLFERFLNPERVSMPDIDVDFCRDRRDETIQYLFERYGQNSVAQIATFNTLAARASIRFSGNALNYPLPYIIEVANLVPKSPEITLAKAFELSPKLASIYQNDKRTRRLLDMALKLEGTSLTTGVHAGGVVISPTTIEEFSPVMISEKGPKITQFDKNDVEKAGLIKFDLLGLKTLTFIDEIVKLINQRPEFKEHSFDLRSIDYEDEKALELLRQGNTYGVFQLEKKGITKVLQRVQPENFEDVATVLALYRPGPLGSGMVDTFIARKKGEEDVSYFHPKLEKILKPTYGVIVYQEQVMQIAREIAGYSLGGADLLRRAMGKKDPEKMAKERHKFEEGAIKNGIDGKLATELFDLMEKFAAYGFNRSHSAAYAVLSIQTAALKSRYPAEFFAAYMNVERDDTLVLEEAVHDAQALGLTIQPPNINVSGANFKVVDDKTISYGLSGLKSISVKTMEDIENTRNQYGLFTDLPDFIFKINKYMKENGRNSQLKSITENLIRSGAFDSLEKNRALLLKALPEQLEYIGLVNKREASSQSEQGELLLPHLWNKIGIEAIRAPVKENRRPKKPLIKPDMPSSVIPWDDMEKLTHEAKSFGFHFSGNVYDAMMKSFKGLEATFPYTDIPTYNDPYQTQLLTGVIKDVFERLTQNGPNSGQKMASVILSNGKEDIRLSIFPELYKDWENKLKPGQFIGFEASIRASKNPKYPDKNITVEQILKGDELEALLVKNINVALTKEELPLLKELHDRYNGTKMSCQVFIPDGENRYFKTKIPLVFNGSVECLDAFKKTFVHRWDLNFSSVVDFPKMISHKSPKMAK